MLEPAGKIMGTVVWDCKIILLLDYKEKGSPVDITGEFYATIFKTEGTHQRKKAGKNDKGCFCKTTQRLTRTMMVWLLYTGEALEMKKLKGLA